MAARAEGYTIGAYLLFGVDDALRIGDDDRTIEAVVVGTPYERLRYHAYLQAYQGLPVVAGDAARLAAADRGAVELVVFAHSRGEADREFMQHFGGGTLEGGGVAHAAVRVASTDPVRDSYYRPDGSVVKRWLGQVTYRFDLRDDPGLAAGAGPATFTFADDRGDVHRYTLVPERYR